MGHFGLKGSWMSNVEVEPLLHILSTWNRQWGILVTLIHVVNSHFYPEPERKWACAVASCAERGKLRPVIVVWLQSCQLTMLSSEIPLKPDNIRIPSNSLWLPLKCHWHCLALQFAGSKERGHVIEINLRLVMGMEMNTSFMLWLRSESWILRWSLVPLESSLLTL